MPLKDNGAISFKLVWDDFELIPDYRIKIINKGHYCALKFYSEVSCEDISWAFHPRSRGFKKVDRVRLAVEIIEDHIEFVINNKEEAEEKYKEPSSITIKLESTQDVVESKIIIQKNPEGAWVKFYDCAANFGTGFHGDEKGIMKLNRFLAAIEIVNDELYYIKNKANE